MSLLHNFFHLLFLLCGLLHPWLAHALPTDRKEILHTQAAYSHADLKKHIVMHEGSVIATQGTTKLTGDKVFVYMNEKNELIKIIAYGKPATYRTLTAPDKPEFYAEGDEIHYFIDQQLVWLITNAKVIQGDHTYTGPRLEYLIEQEIVTSPKSSEGRAFMVIQPNSLSGTPKP